MWSRTDCRPPRSEAIALAIEAATMDGAAAVPAARNLPGGPMSALAAWSGVQLSPPKPRLQESSEQSGHFAPAWPCLHVDELRASTTGLRVVSEPHGRRLDPQSAPEDRLIHSAEHEGVVRPAEPALNVLRRAARMAAPGQGTHAVVQGGPVVDGEVSVPEFGDCSVEGGANVRVSFQPRDG